MYIYYIFINKNINLVIDTFILTFFYNLCDHMRIQIFTNIANKNIYCFI